MNQTPPTSPAPPTAPPPSGSIPDTSGGLDDYQRFAETVGGPSLRVKDNTIQAIVVIGCTLLGAGIGWPKWGMLGAIAGGAVAMIASAFVSGLVLMVLGWVRASKSNRR